MFVRHAIPAAIVDEGPPRSRPRAEEGYADRRERPTRDRHDRREEERGQARRPPAQQTSGKAVAALICGVLTFCVPVLMSIPAVVLGFLALGNIQRSGGRLTGKGLAITGLVLALVGNASLVPIWLFGVPMFQRGFEGPARVHTSNNLKQIALAFHSYNDAFRQFPPAVVYDKTGRPLYSWRVLLLPFIEQDAMYKQFKLDEPWDSPNNIRFVNMMPPTYAHPRLASGKDPTLCYFQVFDGPASGKRPGALFMSKAQPRLPFGNAGPLNLTRGNDSTAINRIIDGTSNTILVAEAADGVPWSKPADLPFEPDQPLPKLGGHFSGGFWVAMADGSVRFIDSRRTSDQTLRIAIMSDDGQVLPPDFDQFDR
jgi:hypothetical protein